MDIHPLIILGLVLCLALMTLSPEVLDGSGVSSRRRRSGGGAAAAPDVPEKDRRSVR